MQNILSEKTEQTALVTLYECVNELIQDSDDVNEKERVKKALQEMTDTTSYLVLGEVRSGKTALLRSLFSDIAEISEFTDTDICEYRWGEQECCVNVSAGYKKTFQCNENIKGLSIIDTKGIQVMQEDSVRKIHEIIKDCGAVLAVFDVNNIRCPKIWDILEDIPAKKVLFFLTKCDQVSAEEIIQAREKMETYMQEAGISAPVFAVSTTESLQSQVITPLENIRDYLRKEVIGVNPLLKNQMQNVENTKQLLAQINQSFELRKKQYESDAEVLQKINGVLDDYVRDHRQVVDRFTKVLTNEIARDIRNYEQEILSKLDPRIIKERFRNRTDFEQYLSMVNDNYRTLMNDSINRKTMETMQGCMRDLEIIFQEAVGYFNKRENILGLNDRFYGTLAESRKQMIVQTKDIAVSTGQFYKTLSEASETLFMQIWEERRKYDRSIQNRGTIAGIGGFLAGVKGGGMLAVMLAGGSTAIGFPGLCLVVVGGLIGAKVINSISSQLFDERSANKMEQNVQKCINQFKEEIENTKNLMTQQVIQQVEELFENEVKVIDSCFTEFRMTVNIDEKRIPLLEKKMEQTGALMQQLEQMAIVQR